LGKGETVFLAGNHDIAMAAYLGCLPVDNLPEDFDMDDTVGPTQDDYFTGEAVKNMHFQGRRWGKGYNYQAGSTMESYGVEYSKTL